MQNNNNFCNFSREDYAAAAAPPKVGGGPKAPTGPKLVGPAAPSKPTQPTCSDYYSQCDSNTFYIRGNAGNRQFPDVTKCYSEEGGYVPATGCESKGCSSDPGSSEYKCKK
uniref:Uncharacterized protein n=1 Tax=viral metagenome TaxID=1070528 RepID=A0A6C0CZM4_9ZZZZ